ncbi:MAG: ATP-dependent helicase, partial [Bacteroidetes bacterium]|nr:ATP-dependent helicase [Bacteroidota bacterium]
MKDIAMTKFERALEKLNDKQRNAVFSTEGPVMVLAGPGTGKTEILAVRIGNILKEMDVNPYNILCLTYSNAAVEAMRNRLTELIGETSEKINIYTFHSFCKNLLDENAANVFEGKSLISDAQRYMIIEKLIYDHLSIEDPKYLKPAFSFGIDNYVKIFNAIRQENLDQRGVLEIANKCITEVLPYEDKYLLKSGKGLKKTGIELQEKINRFANVIALMFDEYEKELEKRNKYEFEHMLNEAVILLGNNRDLLERLKINYQYILVDEFQDTNLKQIALLNILTENVEQPNVFVVGDDDQCIYRFQGASKQNFDWMRNRFNVDLKTITLDLNYRSTPVILQEAFGLIRQNT